MIVICENIKCFLIGILYENNEPSLTRLIAVVAYISFLIASFFLIIKGITWGNYDTFASLTAGGGSVLQILNKYINSKYNSPEDQFPEKRSNNNGSPLSKKN